MIEFTGVDGVNKYLIPKERIRYIKILEEDKVEIYVDGKNYPITVLSTIEEVKCKLKNWENKGKDLL